jgi:hypothetical protein
MRAFFIFALMAAIFLPGCATHRNPSETVKAAKSQIATAKTKVESIRTAAPEKVPEIVAETVQTLDEASCSIDKLQKEIQIANNRADNFEKSSIYYKNRYETAEHKLNSWRFWYFGSLALILSIAIAAFAVSRLKPKLLL